MCLESIVTVLSFHSRIGSCLGELQANVLSEELEALKFIDRRLCTLNRVVHDKSLAFCLQILLRNDIDDVAVFGEHAMEHFDEFGDLCAIIEIADLSSHVN